MKDIREKSMTERSIAFEKLANQIQKHPDQTSNRATEKNDRERPKPSKLANDHERLFKEMLEKMMERNLKVNKQKTPRKSWKKKVHTMRQNT